MVDYFNMQHNYLYVHMHMRLFYVNVQHSYIDMQHNYLNIRRIHVNMRRNCVIMRSKLCHIIILHVDMLYLACTGQKYATNLFILSIKYHILKTWILYQSYYRFGLPVRYERLNLWYWILILLIFHYLRLIL